MAESLTVDGVMNALRNCYDPEIPVNIVDLGLVYGVAIDDDSVKVRMTLTTVGCPAHAYLMHQVQTEIEKIPGVKKAEVERSEEHTSELQSPCNLVCRLLLEK